MADPPRDGEATTMERSTPHRSQSPEGMQPSLKRRRRKALSCFDCRRRKLKCDRECPCARCRQEGHPDSCVFDTGSRGSSELPGVPYDIATSLTETPNGIKPHSAEKVRTGKRELESKISSQERRIAWLEDRLASFETAQQLVDLERLGKPPPPPAPQPKNDASSPPARPPQYAGPIASYNHQLPIRFKGDNFESQFFGPTNPTAMLYHFWEVMVFTKDAFAQFTSLNKVQNDMKVLKTKHRAGRVHVDVDRDEELCNLLPAREVVDSLTTLYFDTFETTYRILHRPSFLAEYKQLWDEGPRSGRPGFIVTLILALATVNCMSLKDSWNYVGESSTARETSQQWIRVCESWIKRQSLKHPTLTVFQARCLVLLAKRVNEINKKHQWLEARTLITHGMAAGLHRDPTLLRGKASLFKQEMRRRIWATMCELELHLSIDRGMATSVAGIPADCAPPLHVADEDLYESMDHLPNSRPLNVFTPVSYLHVSQQSLALRMSLNSKINEGYDSVLKMPYEEFLAYDEKIKNHLSEIPVWPQHGDEKRKTQMAQSLLDLQLRQFLVFLHGPLARKVESNSRYAYSRMILLSSAKNIIEQNRQLVEAGNFGLCFLREDAYLVALYASHNAYLSTVTQNDLFASILRTTFSDMLQQSISMLEDKVVRLGTGYNRYWHASAVYGFVLSLMAPGTTIVQQQQAVDRVTRLYYKALASQEEPSQVFPFLSTNQNIVQDSNLQFPPFDPLDLSGWTLDSLWTFDQT